ncbi:sensor histidine kinase [Bacillus piscicola]|uniref:sensor histidine kinase n=1 Tax=Bacillus piscicola TaxID=1632684 RepID=UPI001F092ABD|nr:HAMP domain-containing sensor histidine kinase [Bacillus piscicola]
MKSLYVKFTLTTISIMLASGVMAFLISNTYYQQVLKNENDEKNTKIAQEIATYAGNTKDLELHTYFEHIASVGYHVYVTNESLEGAYYGDPFRKEELSQDTVQNVLNGNIYHGMAEFPQETFVTGFFANELTNTIGVPFKYKDRQYALFIRPNIKLLFNEMHYLFAWLLGITIFLSIVFVLAGAKFLIQPITRLTKATQALSTGNFDIVLDIDRKDEIGKLSISFNRMAEKLGQLDEMKNDFISSVSHDIQSPLSNINGYASLLEKETLSKQQRAQYLAVIRDETKRLSDMTEQLLLSTSLQHPEDIMHIQTVYLSVQLKEVIRMHQWASQEKGIMIHYSLPETTVVGDASLLYTVWENLLTNALKYNKQNGTIYVAIEDGVDAVSVIFQDEGIGLEQEEAAHIFERFYRADTVRSRGVEGTGLGLAIAHTIVKLHDGKIEVKTAKGKGSTFEVVLPKKKA